MMEKSGNMVLGLCILLLLVFTAGVATADDGNMNLTDNVTDNVTDDNITVNPTDDTDNNNGNITDDSDSSNETDNVNLESIDEVDTGEIADDIEPYEGSIGPGNALYGLKIAFENINMAFTFNETEKLGKQVSRARLRIAEAKAELRNNNQEAANRALELYGEQIESADESAEQLSGNESGMINAQERMVEHQIVLKRLLDANPNSTGLQRAYNNSLKLEEKFELKTQVKLERTLTGENRIVLKAVKKERHEEKEEIELKAEIHGNTTKVKVKVEFLSNSTDNETIAQEILDRMKMDPDTISGILKVETDEESEETEEKLEAKAETERGGMDVEAEYEFGLNTTDENEIKDSIYRKLSALEPDDILDVLEIEIESEDMDEIREERIEIRDERKEERENGRESRREERDENSDSD